MKKDKNKIKSLPPPLLPPFWQRRGKSVVILTPPATIAEAFQSHRRRKIFTLPLAKACSKRIFPIPLLPSAIPRPTKGYREKRERLAASVWGSDDCFFVLGGTSTSNRICANALSPGDLVLFDRNNHKSTWQGALLEAGALPVYLLLPQRLRRHRSHPYRLSGRGTPSGRNPENQSPAR